MQHAITIDARPERILPHLNPAAFLGAIWRHRRVALAIAKREIEARYRTHRLGLLWVVMQPLVLLAVYTFVFVVVFKTSLTQRADEPLGVYALAVFSGILSFGIFRDMATRAPTVIVSHRHLVTKMVFPLEALALSELFIALFNYGVGLAVFAVGYIACIQSLPTWHALLVPVLLLPVCLAGLGVSWLLSSLGTFLRDLSSMIELVVTVLFMTTPIFYRIERVPEPWHSILLYNPLAHVVEGMRAVLLEGALPDWPWFAGALVASLCIAILGYAFFMKSKRAFADVL